MNIASTEASRDVRWAGGRRIGPIGTIYRLLIIAFLVERLYVASDSPVWWQYLLGLVVFPGVLVAAQAAYARWRPRPSPWIGPFAVASIGTAVLFAFFLPSTRPAIGLMIAMLLALSAIKGDPDCEGTVIGNWLLRRADRVACPNSIIDVLERYLRRRSLAAASTRPGTPAADGGHA